MAKFLITISDDDLRGYYDNNTEAATDICELISATLSCDVTVTQQQEEL